MAEYKDQVNGDVPLEQQIEEPVVETPVPENSPLIVEPCGEDLNAFLKVLDNYKPTVPEAVSQYYAEQRGFSTIDPRAIKLISLAADKFLAEAIHESKEQSLLKKKKTAKATGKRKGDQISASSCEQLEPADVEGGLAQFNISWRPARQQQDL